MRQNMLLALMAAFLLSGTAVAGAMYVPGSEDAEKPAPAPALSEADAYLDLNTGRVFQVIYDGLNERFNRADLFAFDLYVNTRTKDTFWLEEALLVNNAVTRDAAGTFKVDPMKVKRDGAGYKVINNKPAIRPADADKADKPKEAAPGAM